MSADDRWPGQKGNYAARREGARGSTPLAYGVRALPSV